MVLCMLVVASVHASNTGSHLYDLFGHMLHKRPICICPWAVVLISLYETTYEPYAASCANVNAYTGSLTTTWCSKARTSPSNDYGRKLIMKQIRKLAMMKLIHLHLDRVQVRLSHRKRKERKRKMAPTLAMTRRIRQTRIPSR